MRGIRAWQTATLTTIALACSLAGPTPVLAADAWGWPVDGEVLTRYRIGGNPYAGGSHRGVDLGAPAGSPVHAATPGTVSFAGEVGSSGLTVAIRTADARFDTSYLHLSRIEVGKGDRVSQGDRIGAVGTSGRGSVAAPHLHFGVREASTEDAYRDPLDFFGARGGPQGAQPPLAPPIISRARPPRLAPSPVPRSALGPDNVQQRASRAVARPATAPHRRESRAGLAIGCIGLIVAAAVAAAETRRRSASSIGRGWVTTSPRRSTT